MELDRRRKVGELWEIELRLSWHRLGDTQSLCVAIAVATVICQFVPWIPAAPLLYSTLLQELGMHSSIPLLLSLVPQGSSMNYFSFPRCQAVGKATICPLLPSVVKGRAFPYHLCWHFLQINIGYPYKASK